MLKRYLFSLILLAASLTVFAQKPVLTPTPAAERLTLDEIRASLNTDALPTGDRSQRYAPRFVPPSNNLGLLRPHAEITAWTARPNAQTGYPDWIELQGPRLHDGVPRTQFEAWLQALAPSWQLRNPEAAFELLKEQTEADGSFHQTYRQNWQGVPLYGNELKAHYRYGRLELLHGRVLPTPADVSTEPTVNEQAALALAREAVRHHTHLKTLNETEQMLLNGSAEELELVIYYPDEQWNNPRLAWVVTIVPHLADRWEVVIDAQTGGVLNEHNHVCHFLPPDGPEVTNATDLQGISRTVHSYEFDGNNYLIDASRPMFDPANSTFPDEGQGVIWTINGNNGSPASDDFQVTHNTSPGNFWSDPLAVSAHYNAGEAYRYFLETHARNSINGDGGNVISLINIADEDGSDLDNAFWNGQAMFYGNGNTDFTSPLAKSLDVAGHEISHGVVQNTANLEYQGESGAMNESFADIFAALIDRDNWQIGEDVVNPSVFPSGALRDLSNPNNGGSSLGDPGWQPAHTDEQYTGSLDNGGVHINSGITNRAFFLFASTVGRERAERVFYRALTVYLTRSSQFLDLRAAVSRAAEDLYGTTEVNAAITAFNTVGIGSGSDGGTPTDTQVDLEINPGNEYVLYTEGNNNNLYIQTPDGELIADPLSNLDPFSKPTVTDDGSLVVFVASDRTLHGILIDWSAGSVSDIMFSNTPIWRNAAISRDGNRLAALTDDNDNRVLVFDLSDPDVSSQEYFLFNPTYTEGVSTGDVQYADVLEWDHAGEFLMYDAFNIIPNQSGVDIDYWDIGFLRAWNRDADNFGDGFIGKLFTALPENTSVGNPTFSNNSPYIVALDFIDGNTGSNFLLGANTETGETGTIFENGRLNYPSYSNQDNAVIFDAEDDSFGNEIIGISELNSDKITPVGGAFIFIDNGFSGARWGTWFANGLRDLVSTLDPQSPTDWATVYPTVSRGNPTLSWELTAGGPVQLQITDLAGRVIYRDAWQSPAGVQTLTLPLTGQASGSYFVQFVAGERVFGEVVVVE